MFPKFGRLGGSWEKEILAVYWLVFRTFDFIFHSRQILSEDCESIVNLYEIVHGALIKNHDFFRVVLLYLIL